MNGRSALQPEPRWLNSIQIRRVARPKETYDVVESIHSILMTMSMRRSVVFLNKNIGAILLTFFCEGDKLWKENEFPVSIIILALII
jgi:hypothetical protein